MPLPTGELVAGDASACEHPRGASPSSEPGIFAVSLALTVAWLYLGVSALTDGRSLQGVVGVGLAVAFAGWSIGILRKRRDTGG